MRALVLILILLNLGFLYWHTQHAVPSARSAVPDTEIPGQPGVARLVLLAERERETNGQTAVSAVPERRCETIGPLPDHAGAEAQRSRLEAQGASVSVRTVSQEVVSSYWVFLPALGSREEARRLAGMLTDRGVRDLYVINEGEHRHGVSLGLFSEHERARRRVEELEVLGHVPRIEARFRTQTVYWLDLTLSPDHPGLDIPAGIGRMPRACPREAGVG